MKGSTAPSSVSRPRKISKGLIKRAAPTPDTNLVEFVDTLQKIDISHKLAGLNATTISDNNGGRIVL